MELNNIYVIPETNSKSYSVLENFQRINKVIPDEQELITIEPRTEVLKAFKLMKKYNYSQLPVVLNDEVLGIFSYRSFAQNLSKLIKTENEKIEISTLIVENFIEKLEFKSVQDEFKDVINILNKDDAVLIGEPNKLIAIITSIDILNHLSRVASPFVLIAEIELTLRYFIMKAFEGLEMKEAIALSLSKRNPKDCPETLEELTFSDYKLIITYGGTYNNFEPLLGDDRKRVLFRLDQINTIRNNVFHFKTDLTKEEFEDLRGHRDWLLLKAKIFNNKNLK